MKISDPLFLAENICLGPIDHEKDAEIEAQWTHDAGYLRMLSLDPAVPQTASQIKKHYEAIEKSAEEKGNLFYFTIRLRQDDRLIGFTRIEWIDWSNGCGHIRIGIGNPADRRCGFGSETLRLLLRFAFAELNLFRLAAVVPDYNTPALGLFKKFGFVEEIRRRQAVFRDLRRWDLVHLGLLKPEWTPVEPSSAAPEPQTSGPEKTRE